MLQSQETGGLAMGRIWTIAIDVLVIGNVLSVGAQEQSNQWCANFSGGPTNCDFATLEDCMKAIKGKTGLCDHNTQYVSTAPHISDMADDPR